MTATIFRFPKTNKVKGYKIPLYTDEEIFLTIAAMNMFCSSIDLKINNNNLTNYDPVLVIDALTKAKESDLFSYKTKSTFTRILQSVEKIEIKV